MLVPEQINLQLAANGVVVASFVTYEDTAPTAPAVALFGPTPSSLSLVTGVTHTYHLPDTGRTYYLHFVKFAGTVEMAVDQRVASVERREVTLILSCSTPGLEAHSGKRALSFL